MVIFFMALPFRKIELIFNNRTKYYRKESYTKCQQTTTWNA